MRVNTPDALFESSVPGLELLGRGKVRDIYAVSSDELLIVTTDRLSAYDVVMPDAVPGKGRILTRLSLFWFEMMSDIIDNHLTGRNIDEVIEDAALRDRLRDQSLIVKRLHPLPVEAVVRGYLIGSGWRDYQHSGQVCGIDLPSGLKLADRLPQTLFTPATKASVGEHDENVSFESISRLIGDELAGRVRDLSVAIYERAAAHAMDRGIIIADTKFEFGLDETGKLYLIDEVLTPDSSRFWPVDRYMTGISPPSFDKQFVRDYLDTLAWDKTAPGPSIPSDIIRQTGQRYEEALSRLTA